ncbi:MAG: putative porin, partial [Planctomycetes bacterium]|nr:putative porin [Planctomycetota bacterium]
MFYLPLLYFSVVFAPPETPVVGEALAAEPGSVGLPEGLEIYGNMRLRMESTLDQANGEDRHRGRLRFRVGAKVRVAQGLRAEVRLTTASGDARNPHWDLGGSNGNDTISGSDVALDRINLVWTPTEGATVVAGKMGNPLAQNPVFSEWVLDGDIQPSGIAGIWQLNERSDVRLAHFVIDENNAPSSDPALTIVQLNYGADGTDLDWDVNTSLWNWTNEGGPVDFMVWDTILSAKKNAWTGSFEFMQNLDDDSGDDTGFALGLKHGKGGKQGESQFFGNYFDFDVNASLWGVGQDDVPIGTSADGLSGFVVGYKYWWHDNTTVKLW